MRTILLCLLLCTPGPAAASVLFDWTGTCVVGCTGQATMHLETTAAYVPGTGAGGVLPVGPDPLLIGRPHYTDSQVEALMTNFPALDFQLLLPAQDAPGPAVVFYSEQSLRTFTDGTWRWTGQAGPLSACDPGTLPLCLHTATGTSSAWHVAAAVPWPPLGLLVGLAGPLVLLYMHAHRVAGPRRRVDDHRIDARLHGGHEHTDRHGTIGACTLPIQTTLSGVKCSPVRVRVIPTVAVPGATSVSTGSGGGSGAGTVNMSPLLVPAAVSTVTE